MKIVGASSKGFGSNSRPKVEKVEVTKNRNSASAKRISKDKAVNQAIEIIEKTKGSPSDSNPENGRVDYVKVSNWGSGNAEDLGNLQLAAPPETLTISAPFYESLARYLESLQSDGSLAIAQPKGALPPPPFHRWAFTESHYTQHLIDMLSVHHAIENAHISITKTISGTELVDISKKDRLLNILQKIDLANGLARSKYIALDIKRLQQSMPLDSSNDNLDENLDDILQTVLNSDDNNNNKVSPNALVYAQTLSQRAIQCHRSEDEQELAIQVIKFLANVYVVFLTLLTSGGRIGAAAAEKLNLFNRDALHLYRSYPENVSQPLIEFRSAIDAVGELLEDDEKDIFMKELPRAFQRTSLLLESLAKE